MLISRKRLKHADAVAFGVDERDILSYTGNLHRLAEHITTRIYYFLYRFFNIIHCDHYGRILRGPICFSLVKATVNRARLFGPALTSFSGGCKDVIAHIFAQHLRLPAEC